jgi:cytochrome c-type biogenesis protein CcmE
MRHMRFKLTVAGIALLVAVSYLAFAGLKDGWVYHVDVDQFVQNTQMHTQRVRLVGKVSPEGLEADAAKLFANFGLVGQSSKVQVAYKGAVPELFKADSEVIVEGRMTPTGTFQADLLMTKCASKYQSEEHAKRNSRNEAL